MKQHLHIICNLHSGAGQSASILTHTKQLLHKQHIPYTVHTTEYAKHATTLAREIANVDCSILVIGGDGTLHEVIDGLFTLDIHPPVAYIPAGTGNDFSHAWQRHATPQNVIHALLHHRIVTYVPIFVCHNHDTHTQHVVLNNMGFGLDADINVASKQLQQTALFSKKGLYKLSYIASIWQCVKRLTLFDVRVTVDGTTHTVEQCGLACVMNIPYLGGGVHLDRQVKAAHAEVSFIAFHHITFKVVLNLIWRVFVSHNQHESLHVTRFTGETMSVRIHTPIRSHVDGEDLDQVARNVDYTLANYPFYLPHKAGKQYEQV